MTLGPETDERRAKALAESEEIWHDIARAALRDGNVPLAYAAVVEYGFDVERIANR